MKDTRYSERLKHLKLPSLAYRHRRGVIIRCFEIVRELDDIPCEKYFIFVEKKVLKDTLIN